MTLRTFTTEPLWTILAELETTLRVAAPGDEITFVVLDPEIAERAWPGTVVELGGQRYVHRSYRTWFELAERLRLRFRTPRPLASPLVQLRFTVLDPARSWHTESVAEPSEKYGAGSGFAQISKLEDPGFLVDLAGVSRLITLPAGARVLDLGIGSGDEFWLLAQIWGTAAAEWVGVDHCRSALDVAATRFPGPSYRFVHHDLNDFAALSFAPFDLVLSVGTFQSPGLDDRALLRHIVQHWLTPTGALVLGLPNCRYVDGEVLYGAKSKNYEAPEASLVVKDLAFYRKYLQQHGRRVLVTGKHYVWVVALPIGGQIR